MKKQHGYAVLGAALLAVGEAGAAGLGASVQANSGTIYLPLNATGTQIEPFFRYGRASASGDTLDAKFTTYDLGVGVFLREPAADKLSVYYGGRIFLSHSYSNTSGSNDQTWNGFGLAPTFGVEYMIADRVSIAAEGSITYVSGSGKEKSVTPAINYDDTTVSTDSRVLIRFYF